MNDDAKNIHLNKVIDIWLEASAARHKRSTHSTYEVVANRHLRPELGDCLVEDISSEQLAVFIREKTFGTPEQKALSSSTVCSIVTVLRAVFKYAETLGCHVQVWGALNRPKLVTGETSTLTAGEQERLEAFLLPGCEPERLGVLVCLYTGLRLGEICALKWGDISLDAGTLTVRRTVQRIKNPKFGTDAGESKTRIVFDSPKSRHSNRTIPLPTFLTDELRRQRQAEDCFLLTGDKTGFIEPRTFQNKFKAMLAQAGVRDINFHALRHPYVKLKTKKYLSLFPKNEPHAEKGSCMTLISDYMMDSKMSFTL